jgi:hypothetical protein
MGNDMYKIHLVLHGGTQIKFAEKAGIQFLLHTLSWFTDNTIACAS